MCSDATSCFPIQNHPGALWKSLSLACLTSVGMPNSFTEKAFFFLPRINSYAHKRQLLWSARPHLAQGWTLSIPVVFCTQWSYYKNMGSSHSATGTKAEEKVFLLYFEVDSSKIKLAKILPPAAVPAVKPAQAGEGHEEFCSQKASL